MTKRERTNGQTTIQTLHIKLKIEPHQTGDEGKGKGVPAPLMVLVVLL